MYVRKEIQKHTPIQLSICKWLKWKTAVWHVSVVPHTGKQDIIKSIYQYEGKECLQPNIFAYMSKFTST